MGYLERINAILSDPTFWAGFFTILLYAASRFNERRVDSEKDLDPPVAARCYTTTFRFNSALVIYCLSFLTIYGALILLFTFKFAQDVLFEFLSLSGTELKVPTAAGNADGLNNPAWVAAVIPILVASIPAVKAREERFRRWLWFFAGVPRTARILADDLVAWARSEGAGFAPTNFNLNVIHQELGDKNRRYRDFFAQNQGIWQAYNKIADAIQSTEPQPGDMDSRIDRALDGMLAYLASKSGPEGAITDWSDPEDLADLRAQARRNLTGEPVPPDTAAGAPHLPMTGTTDHVLTKKARMIACALLYAFKEDYEARRFLNDAAEAFAQRTHRPVDHVRIRFSYPRFRFGGAQLLAGAVLAFVSVAAIGIIGEIREAVTAVEATHPLSEYTQWFLFALVGAAAFSLPLIPAASLRHFINDQQITEPEKWVIAVAFNFAAAVGLSLIVLLILQFLRQLDSPGEVDVARMALWTLPMAGVSVTFLFATGCPLSSRRGWNRVIDFLLFAVVGTACAGVASFGQELIAGNLQQWLTGEPDAAAVARKVRSLLIVGLASGLLGTLHCESSRRGLRP